MTLLFANIGLFFLGTALFVVSLFLILLVLVQRGKGGGLTGALGGMGGESAFGTKAGDVFTRITIGTAVVWLLLCIITIQITRPKFIVNDDNGAGAMGAPADPDEDEKAKKENEDETK